jgi:hypothetical protein
LATWPSFRRRSERKPWPSGRSDLAIFNISSTLGGTLALVNFGPGGERWPQERALAPWELWHLGNLGPLRTLALGELGHPGELWSPERTLAPGEPWLLGNLGSWGTLDSGELWAPYVENLGPLGIWAPGEVRHPGELGPLWNLSPWGTWTPGELGPLVNFGPRRELWHLGNLGPSEDYPKFLWKWVRWSSKSLLLASMKYFFNFSFFSSMKSIF